MHIPFFYYSGIINQQGTSQSGRSEGTGLDATGVYRERQRLRQAATPKRQPDQLEADALVFTWKYVFPSPAAESASHDLVGRSKQQKR